MEVKICAFTRGSAAVRYSSVLLKRKEEPHKRAFFLAPSHLLQELKWRLAASI